MRKKYLTLNLLTKKFSFKTGCWDFQLDAETWQTNDYVLALKYYPRVDVDEACKTIELEHTTYASRYPQLEVRLKYIGNYFNCLEKFEDAEKVFKLNHRLHPDGEI